MTHREKAIKIMNRNVASMAGFGLDDLPDTFELCGYIDELEEMLENEEDMEEILKVAREFASEFVDEELGSFMD